MICRFLRERRLFVINDVPREEIWVNLLRIIAGAVAFERSYNILIYELVIDTTPERALVAIWACIASGAFCIGLLTPFFILQLFLLNSLVFDPILSTITLGSAAQQILLLIFLFVPAGRCLSVDRLIINSDKWPSNAVKRMYHFFGMPTVNRVGMVKFAGFISYGLFCLYSVYGHFQDPNWVNGTANVYLLTSNWLTGPHELFRYLFSQSQHVAIIISMVLIYMMMAWELLLIPMVLVRGISRIIAIWYGLAFFFVSMYVLQLGKLPQYQFVLWAILFWPGWGINRNGKYRLNLLYDDRCNLCDKTVIIISRLDWFRVVNFSPLSKNISMAEEYGLTVDEIRNNLYGIDVKNGKKFSGYDTYLELTKRILVFYPMFPILSIGKLFHLGPLTYRFFAQNRIKLFGVCYVPSVAPETIDMMQEESSPNWKRNNFFNAFLATYFLLALIYIFRLPYFNSFTLTDRIVYQFSFLKNAPSINGQIPLLVFTPEVLYMGTHYFTVTRISSDGREELLPYVGQKGERLEWVLNSDRLYFGHALDWRREMYGLSNQRVCYVPERDDKYLRQLFLVAQYEYVETPEYYRVDYYHQDLATVKYNNGFWYEHELPEHVCTVTFQNDGWSEVSDSMNVKYLTRYTSN